VGPRVRLDAVENYFFSGIELRFLGNSAFGLATIATEFNNKRPVLKPRPVDVRYPANCHPTNVPYSYYLGLVQYAHFGSSVQTGRGIRTMELGKFDRVQAPYPGRALLPSGSPNFANIF
jgi:hypothetical protein